MQINEVRTFPHTIYTQENSKWPKDLNTKQDTIKLQGENTGKNILTLGQSPKAIEIKAKIN